MSPAIFCTTAARWAMATQQPAASPSRQLRRNFRRMRLRTRQRYRALHECARIYHDLAARETKRSERKLMLLCLADEADARVERAEISLRKFRIAPPLPAETRLRRLIRWVLLRWRISWTLALLDRIESRRSRAMLKALMQLARLCRMIATARMRPNQFSIRLSSHHPDDP